MSTAKRMSWSEAQEAARAICRGSYQVDIVFEATPLSGAGFSGKAREFSGHYAESRKNLLARLQESGIPFRTVVLTRHRLALVWGDWAVEQAKRVRSANNSVGGVVGRLLVMREEPDTHRQRVAFVRRGGEVQRRLHRTLEAARNAARNGHVTPGIQVRVGRSCAAAEAFADEVTAFIDGGK